MHRPPHARLAALGFIGFLGVACGSASLLDDPSQKPEAIRGTSEADGLTCPTGETACNGACVNLQTDAKNCGACAHSCGSGACLAGACQSYAVGSIASPAPIGSVDTGPITTLDYQVDPAGAYLYFVAQAPCAAAAAGGSSSSGGSGSSSSGGGLVPSGADAGADSSTGASADAGADSSKAASADAGADASTGATADAGADARAADGSAEAQAACGGGVDTVMVTNNGYPGAPLAFIGSGDKPPSGSSNEAPAAWGPSNQLLTLGANDSLFVNVWLNPANPPASLVLVFGHGAATSQELTVYWGTSNYVASLPSVGPGTGLGPLPNPGGWARLVIPASALGNAPIIESAQLYASGSLALDHFGVTRNVCGAGDSTDAGAGHDATTSCGGDESLCAGACVDESSDPKNCGACGTTCASSETCTNGACGCESGLSKCGDACKDFSDDPANCGACQNACPTGDSCVAGACSSPSGSSGGGAASAGSGSGGGVGGGSSSSGGSAGNCVGDVPWFDDALPAGATAEAWAPWTWTSTAPPPYHGSLDAETDDNTPPATPHSLAFTGATAEMTVAPTDTVFVYLWLDPANPPSAMSFSLSQSGARYAIWQAGPFPGGNTDAMLYMGQVPAAGQWTRMNIPASALGVTTTTNINFFQFMIWGGHGAIDYVGKTSCGTGTDVLRAQPQAGSAASGTCAALERVSLSAAAAGDDAGLRSISSGVAQVVAPVAPGYSYALGKTAAYVLSTPSGISSVQLADGSFTVAPLASVAATKSLTQPALVGSTLYVIEEALGTLTGASVQSLNVSTATPATALAKVWNFPSTTQSIATSYPDNRIVYSTKTQATVMKPLAGGTALDFTSPYDFLSATSKQGVAVLSKSGELGIVSFTKPYKFTKLEKLGLGTSASPVTAVSDGTTAYYSEGAAPATAQPNMWSVAAKSGSKPAAMLSETGEVRVVAQDATTVFFLAGDGSQISAVGR